MRRLLASLVVGFLLAVPASTYAFNPFGGGACDAERADDAVACTTGTADPIAGSKGIFIQVTRIIAYLGGAIAIIMIIVGSIKFITSGSDISTGARHDNDVEEARRTIAAALIGLVVIVLAQAIIVYFVRRL